MGRGRRPQVAQPRQVAQSQQEELHVRRNSWGGWDVLSPDGVACSHHETDAQAVLWTRGVLRESGGGVIVVECPDERVVIVDSTPAD